MDLTLEITLIPPDLIEKAMSYFLFQIILSQQDYEKYIVRHGCSEEHPTIKVKAFASAYNTFT